MEVLNIKGGNDIPTVICDPVKGFIELKGKAITEDPFNEIFEPILLWLKEYTNNTLATTTVNIQLEYFNTSSSKYLLEVLRVLEAIHKSDEDTSVLINWFYEDDDEDMLEAGQDYEAMVKVPFEMKLIDN